MRSDTWLDARGGHYKHHSVLIIVAPVSHALSESEYAPKIAKKHARVKNLKLNKVYLCLYPINQRKRHLRSCC